MKFDKSKITIVVLEVLYTIVAIMMILLLGWVLIAAPEETQHNIGTLGGIIALMYIFAQSAAASSIYDKGGKHG